jgi:hypothetical protein
MQVIVWLGPEDGSTPTVLETIWRLSPGLELTPHHRNCLTINGSEANVVEHHSDNSKFTPRHWISLNKFMQSHGLDDYGWGKKFS